MARKILIADDSPTIRKIVELTFSDTDIRVEAAESGREAMDCLDSMQPDLVLADVFMPDPSGYELCRTIKASERPVPVVLLAGTFEPLDPDLARECGADGHLVKPFESETLREKVQMLLEPPPVAEEIDEVAEEEPEPVDEVMADLCEAVSVVDEDETDDLEPEALEPSSAEPEPYTETTVELTPELVDAVADEVVQRLSREVLREVAWEVVPKLASEIIRERIRELERQELEDESD